MKFFDNLFDDSSFDKYAISGLNMELASIYVYDKFIHSNRGCLVVANSLYEANNIYKKLANYTDRVLFFPMDDFLTSEAVAISPEFKTERIVSLNKLVSDSNYIVVSNLMGFLRYLPSHDLWKDNIIKLSVNMSVDRDEFINKLFDMGYERDVIVSETGKIGIRGYVIDIFAVGEDNPIRIEFWGDVIDSIKYFDMNTQLSFSNVDEITIYPYTEFIVDKEFDNMECSQKFLKKYSSKVVNILDYIGDGTMFFYDYNQICNGYDVLKRTIFDYNVNNDIKNMDYMFNLKDIDFNKIVYFLSFDNVFSDNDKVNIIKYSSNVIHNYNGNYELLRDDLKNYLKNNKTILFCIGDVVARDRVIKYLDIDNIVFTSEDNITNNYINFISKDVDSGFIYKDYVVLSLNDIFSHEKSSNKYKSKYKIGHKLSNIGNINKGDYIVHEVFGIGIYDGINTITKNGIQKDYIRLLYDGGDCLYIPVENINRISKYSGKEGVSLKVSKLNSNEWKKKKGKVREKLESIAKDLLKLSAEREVQKGYAFSMDDESQIMFDNEFNYEETPDQMKAIKMIKSEMEKSKPMDMLLCGDVGYGKTEVAFRAMFKAVNDGKQVAYLCPTTILSSQQYNSAISRFANFPVRIALINRFVDKDKQKKIIEDLKEGKIDIIFGTHRLLSDDIQYKDLGLLVIDEEQRFGVTHKEKIKRYKSNVDVLTLSATPIPRTLQMSMSGIRSLSLIETPPALRYPIQTYVLAENKLIIKDAIYKELSRGGQVFILYNRVESIESKVLEIKDLVPDARIDFAHGRMTKDALENKMMKFINHEYDIMVCTTIIETGIDIPNANTLIIIDADRFGLSQLYQLRGRVGRSTVIGYCYLMYDKNKMLNDIAIKRLDTIKEFTELGSGFKIAMRDLSIRGAGDILGRDQSGFVDTIGIDLYLKMLNEAVRAAKGEEVVEEDDNSIKKDKQLIEVSTHIDNSYVSDTELKIEIHKKINEVDSKEKFDLVKHELEDRFGKLSDELIIYMYEEWFEYLASSLNITNVVNTKNYIDIELPKELSDKINGEELFNETYKLSKMFRLSYKNNCIHVILDIVKLDKHFILYLVDLLIVIKKMIDNK